MNPTQVSSVSCVTSGKVRLTVKGKLLVTVASSLLDFLTALMVKEKKGYLFLIKKWYSNVKGTRPAATAKLETRLQIRKDRCYCVYYILYFKAGLSMMQRNAKSYICCELSRPLCRQAGWVRGLNMRWIPLLPTAYICDKHTVLLCIHVMQSVCVQFLCISVP